MILRCLWCDLPCAKLEPGILAIELRHYGDKHETRLAIADLIEWRHSGKDRLLRCADGSCDQTAARFDDEGQLVIDSKHHGSNHQNRLNIDWLYQQSRCLTFMDAATTMEKREIELLEKLLGLGLPGRVEVVLRMLVS